MLHGSCTQANVQVLDDSHCTVQFPEVHVNSQVLPVPHMHCWPWQWVRALAPFTLEMTQMAQ